MDDTIRLPERNTMYLYSCCLVFAILPISYRYFEYVTIMWTLWNIATSRITPHTRPVGHCGYYVLPSSPGRNIPLSATSSVTTRHSSPFRICLRIGCRHIVRGTRRECECECHLECHDDVCTIDATVVLCVYGTNAVVIAFDAVFPLKSSWRISSDHPQQTGPPSSAD